MSHGQPHCWQMDYLTPNTGAVKLIADIANCNFTGFASWHRLHHDRSIAKYQLEACSTTAAGGGPPQSASIVNFADFAGDAAKVANS